jgi:hypothetical protein
VGRYPPGCSHLFLNLFRDFPVLSGKQRFVPVDDETPVVISRISKSVGVQSFGGAHRGKCLRTCIHMDECACVL